MKINSIILLLACFLLLNTNLKGQKLIDDTEILKILVFENTVKDKKKLVSQGGRLKYRLRGDSKKVLKGSVPISSPLLLEAFCILFFNEEL